MNRTDINRISEVVLIPLFAELFGYKHLKTLNTPQQANHPAIDLGDEIARVAFQITSNANNKKVKETLRKFVKNHFYEHYDRLIIYVLTTKQKNYSGRGHKEIVQDKFVFDTQTDVKDYRDLLAIVANLQIEQASKIERILEVNFSNLGRPHLVGRGARENPAIVSVSSDTDAHQSVEPEKLISHFRLGVGAWQIVDDHVRHYLELNELELLKNRILTSDILPHLSETTLDALHETGCITEDALIHAKSLITARGGKEGLPLLLLAAASAMSKNKSADLLKYAERALRIDPKEHHAWMVRAFALAELERYKEALGNVERALELEPDAYYGWFLRGAIHCHLGDYYKAITSLDKGLEDHQDSNAWFLKGLALYVRREFAKALTSFERGFDLDPNDGHAFYLSGAAWWEIGNLEKANECFQRALDVLPDDDTTLDAILTTYANLFVELGDYEKSIELTRRALAINPGNHDAWLSQGRALTQVEKYQEAVGCFTNVLTLQPENKKALYARGVLFNRLLQPEKALLDFNRALDLKIGFSHIWQSRALSFLMKFFGKVTENRLDLAKQHWNAAIDSARRSAEEDWYEPFADILLLTALRGHLEFTKQLIIESDLSKNLFPLAQAVNYVLTGDNKLVETLAPDVRSAVNDVIKKLKRPSHEANIVSDLNESL